MLACMLFSAARLHTLVFNPTREDAIRLIVLYLSGERERLRWYGHVCRMLDTRLPKVMLFGQVKGSTPPGRPRKTWNDIVLSDFQLLNITRPYRDAQNKPAWRERTWATHT